MAFDHQKAKMTCKSSNMSKEDHSFNPERPDMLDVLDRARAAFIEIETQGAEMTEFQLSQSASYARLLNAGIALGQQGGRPAIDWATDNFFPNDPRRTDRAKALLEEWWAGVGDWDTPCDPLDRIPKAPLYLH
jgi:hypothetical protein